MNNMITEYELYSDERVHRNASGKHLLLGGVVCTDNGRKRLREALSKVRLRFSLSHEMRWAKVSKAYLDAYTEWMGVFFQDPFARFSLLSINESDWRQIHPRSETAPSHDEQRAEQFYEFLTFTFGPPRDTRKWWVYPDAGFFSKDAVLSKVETLYNRTHYGLGRGRFIRRADSRDSRSEDLIQLSDVLLAVIACDMLGPMPTSPPKRSMVEYWQQQHADTPTTRKGLDRLSYSTWAALKGSGKTTA